MKKVPVQFPITVSWHDEQDGFMFTHEYIDMYTYPVPEKFLKGAAAVFSQHGCQPVMTEGLKTLNKKVVNAFIKANPFKRYSDEFQTKSLDIWLSEDMCPEILYEISKFVENMDVTFTLYYPDRDPMFEGLKVTLPMHVIHAMMSAWKLYKRGMNEFEILKEHFPEEYDYVMSIIPKGAQVRDFPYEVTSFYWETDEKISDRNPMPEEFYRDKTKSASIK